MAFGRLPIMGSLKSQGEIYLDLCLQLIRCDPLVTIQSKHLKNDLRTVSRRFHSEGLSFLTKTLPKLGKALDKGLVSHRLSVPNEFKRSHQNSSIPAFMQAYFSRLFDSDGMLLEEADIDALKHLRQVLYFAYKLEVPYLRAEESAVIASFIATDQELSFLSFDAVEEILQLASRITKGIFLDFDPKDIMPRHGPGAVATGEKLEDKWVFSRLYDNIHQCYPYYRFFTVGGSRELQDRLDWYKNLQRLKTGVAKVVLVPKDSRGPRLISCEPLEYQWIQQGLGRKLFDYLERINPLTRKRVNFTHQDINQKLAQDSSRSLKFATLDLSDASDRVSLSLVRRVFIDLPELLGHLEACRTTATTLPDGRVLDLNKFAPMGSALCFPVEAYIFWVLIVAARVWETREPLKRVGESTFVYGDDIIVPTDKAPQCIQILESVGLRVNRDKSCITGSFRESCGVDAFKGVNVTPARLRTLWTGRSTDGSAYASYAAMANELGFRGYKIASTFLWNRIEQTYGRIPYGTVNSGFPCKVVQSPMLAISLNRKLLRWRLNRRLQRIEFLVKFLKPRKIASELDDWPRLLRDTVSEVSLQDPSVVVVPRSTQIKRGWAAVFS